jgi:FixJ family two-component response regulator/HAMP domain-containing protein
MESTRPKRFPWKSWKDFLAWLQDFSLWQKVLGGFLGVVIMVGLATMLIGSRLARETIMDRAKGQIFSDLATASFILNTSRELVDAKIQLVAGSQKVKEALAQGDLAGARDRLATLAAENDLDFFSLADDKGRVFARAFGPEAKSGDDVSQDALVMQALKGKHASGFRIVPSQRLALENPMLVQRLTNKEIKAGMVIEAAHPILNNGKVIGALYGGTLLNGNNLVVERIARPLFKGDVIDGKEAGFVTLYQGDTVISTSIKDPDGAPLVGSRATEQIRRDVLEKHDRAITEETRKKAMYLTATEPLTDLEGKVIGALQVATLESPITIVSDRLVVTFGMIGILGVLLMAAITYFLVKWISYPLEQMLHSAKRAAEGDLSHEVPVIARDEIGQLAASFNLMIRNLAESQRRLEAWGKELSTKIAAQTGELNQAREQVARVKKLASLEKMADGMARIMAHISDPMVDLASSEEAGSPTPRILVLDTDEKVLDICQRIFESEGMEVTLARTVSEAFAELENEFCDVVVADAEMPEMSAQELLKEIRYRQPEVLVLVTASFKATEEAVETVKMGAYDYIPKPFGPHQILLMVYTALQTRQMIEKTRRQHAQQRAETIFQRLPVAIALADGAHRVVYQNRAFIELASQDGEEVVQGKTFKELFGVDPLESEEEATGSRWLQLEKVSRTAKLYNFKLPEEDLRVLMLLDVTDTVMKDQQADVLKAETISKAQQVIHQQMRVAQEIAGLLGETTAETKAALFELIKLAGEMGEPR